MYDTYHQCYFWNKRSYAEYVQYHAKIQYEKTKSNLILYVSELIPSTWIHQLPVHPIFEYTRLFRVHSDTT